VVLLYDVVLLCDVVLLLCDLALPFPFFPLGSDWYVCLNCHRKIFFVSLFGRRKIEQRQVTRERNQWDCVELVVVDARHAIFSVGTAHPLHGDDAAYEVVLYAMLVFLYFFPIICSTKHWNCHPRRSL
jgi:hypothetical protein